VSKRLFPRIDDSPTTTATVLSATRKSLPSGDEPSRHPPSLPVHARLSGEPVAGQAVLAGATRRLGAAQRFQSQTSGRPVESCRRLRLRMRPNRQGHLSDTARVERVQEHAREGAIADAPAGRTRREVRSIVLRPNCGSLCRFRVRHSSAKMWWWTVLSRPRPLVCNHYHDEVASMRRSDSACAAHERPEPERHRARNGGGR
jgi:hypothetical protein